MSELSSRPSLLYISPVIPSLTGNGLAMRAGMVLEALAERYRVSLLAVPLYPSFEPEISQAFLPLCENTRVIPPCPDPQHRIREAGEAFREHEFDIIHVFRLSAMPFARPYFSEPRGRVQRHLDLDDIESKTHRRIAALHRDGGDESRACREQAESRRFEMLETAAFRIFDRVYVCAEADKQELLNRGAAQVCVLRNAVRLPLVSSRKKPQDVFRILFLGTLGYYPNEDAARYFCGRILPLIRQGARTSFVVDLVGAGGSESLRSLAASDVNVVGRVPDVQPWYEACQAVIVPLRAGGGTRIKILEAFSYKRPVVTTSIGLEGIDAIPNEHVLVADTPDTFASACLQLMTDPALAESMVQKTNALVLESYSSEALKKSVSFF